MSSHAYRAVLALCALCLSTSPLLVHGQSVVPVGAGSYASQVPPANYYTDSYYGLPAAQIEPLTSGSAIFNTLHLDPSLSGTAIPTNHWWTDMLIADRSTLLSGSTQYILKQDPYGGNMWFYPGMLAPKSYGLDLYFPNSWEPANSNGSPQGAINPGPVLSLYGDVPYAVPSSDFLIADFESGYPVGTTRTGTGFAATPSAGSGLTGMMGNFCASTRDAGDGATGELDLPSFTIQKHYLSFLICGGTSAQTQVRLIVNGNVVLAASGQDTTTFAWVTWDISPWAGQTAYVQVGDESTGGWGFIAADEIVESDSNNPVGRYGGTMIATNSDVTNWGDWNVDFKLPDAYGHELDVSMARGIPLTWTTWDGMNPKIILSGTTLYDINNNPITTGTSFTTNAFAFNYQGRAYGIFLPDNTPVTVTSGYIEPQLSGSNNYMVIGYLPATSNLAEFNAVAFARPTKTQLSWSMDAAGGYVDTTWNITTTPMKGTNLNTIQGWLPHHYRTTVNNLSFTGDTYLTPRGTMQCAIGNQFQINFPFKGIVPVLPAPVATGTTDDFQPARMLWYLQNFNPGTMLGDTYWSGKAMALCAQYMAWANQMGDTADFLRLQTALEAAMENWLTYTPNEQNGYFALYPNFHAIIGWDASYGTQAFNDLHFHYGYFAVTGAIIAMYDPAFLANYGQMLRMLVKCYGNWDRTDNSEPFFRTFDIWEGHSNAGGTSSANGENQESSSEAMQSWAGMYLLGGMLNDSAMTAAGAMGFSMESAAVNEYWQDIYQTNFPPGYNRAGNGILEANAYAYGTYFSGDPAWVYGIQYTPSNHWNNYLARYQPATVSAKYQDMWSERAAWCASYPLWTGTGAFTAGEWVQYDNSIYSVSGTVSITGSGGNPAADTGEWVQQADCSSSSPNVLGGGLDHVILSYQGLWDHDNAAAEFDRYYAAGDSTATNNSDSGSTYYLIQASRCLGDQDYTYTTSIPTSAVYVNAATGVRTFTVFNPLGTTAPAV
ncbi:MAG TPA: glycosyl hydrolase, partial [Chthoniobacteraceae bacterium]|nr:glycosyl hydrolase [Chthoniobacteraceae bacterium]